jgi:hypothetical protein
MPPEAYELTAPALGAAEVVLAADARDGLLGVGVAEHGRLLIEGASC